jgi:hypothetical protein
MSGRLQSKDLVKNFSKDWLPWYQREKILNKSKINRLKEIFVKGDHIDAIQLNFIGKYDYDERKCEAVLNGKFNVIDGQQRLWALKETGVLNRAIPVELYLNLPIEEEIKLFHRYNRDGTKLTFGELAKSTTGSFADLVRKLLKSKSMPVTITVNSNKVGVNLSVTCQLIFYIQRTLAGRDVKTRATGKRLLRFLSESHPDRNVLMVEFVLKKLMEEYCRVFGDFDAAATAYKRIVFIVWNIVMIDNFLTTEGKIDYGRFETKIEEAAKRLIRNSRLLEIVGTNGGEAVVPEIYNMIVSFLNYKLKNGLLKTYHENNIEEEEDEEEEYN